MSFVGGTQLFQQCYSSRSLGMQKRPDLALAFCQSLVGYRLFTIDISSAFSTDHYQ